MYFLIFNTSLLTGICVLIFSLYRKAYQLMEILWYLVKYRSDLVDYKLQFDGHTYKYTQIYTTNRYMLISYLYTI